MDKLMNSYIMSTVEQFDLNCTAARVLLNAMPGLESAAVFRIWSFSICHGEPGYCCSIQRRKLYLGFLYAARQHFKGLLGPYTVLLTDPVK
ncbi:unnamed protein product [Pocillopora meandrina]|uniref:Uncharacterized protein n=1 Tax=Pocillopora meandrina TaxID=46732 RepID=A0AAU9X4I3_9CNID|nr:unnamed protein product [Pocillopora meandrina]